MMTTLALAALVTLAPIAVPGTPAAGSEALAAAIVEAVRVRFGPGTRVEIADVVTAAVLPLGRLDAVPDPDSRVGGRVGFRLVSTRVSGGRAQAIRVGRATATVRVWVEHVRMRRFVARGMDVSADDVDVVRDEVAAVVLHRLPALAEVVGGRALRDLAVGASVTTAAIVLQPLVRAGDDVVATAGGPDFQVTAAVVAAESGAAGAVIHVVNRESRRTLRARVVSKGVVDVLHD